MSRYRPPQPRSSAYITRAGLERLQAELAALWVRRADVTAHLAAAAAEGDRSENAEYIYRKKELREMDRRIRYLQKRLPDLTVVEPRAIGSAPSDTVYFGAEVATEDADGVEHRFRLVGADEIDPGRGRISIDSPLGKALMKRQLDDDIRLCIGGIDLRHTIIGIRYPLDP